MIKDWFKGGSYCSFVRCCTLRLKVRGMTRSKTGIAKASIPGCIWIMGIDKILIPYL